MKKIIPFTKDISLKSKISEITSISLDHDLTIKDHLLSGNFYIKGAYKMAEASEIATEYSYKIPCEISISNNYEIVDAFFDIDDFYYEVINEDILRINIDVFIDGLEEKEEIVATKIPIVEIDDHDIKDNRHEQEENIVKIEDVVTNINSNNDDETYLTYSIYIMRDEDSIDDILSKYAITKNELLKYNSIDEIKAGSKLVIPASVKMINEKEFLRKYEIKPISYEIKNNSKIIASKDNKYVIKKKKKSKENLFEYLSSRSFLYFPRMYNRDTNDEYDIYEYIEGVNTPKEQKAQDIINLVALLHSKTTHYKKLDIEDYKIIYEDLKKKYLILWIIIKILMIK